MAVQLTLREPFRQSLISTLSNDLEMIDTVRKVILCLAKVIGFTTLVGARYRVSQLTGFTFQYCGRGCLLIFLIWTIPIILARPTTVMELSASYLMVVTYFFIAWIWPSKHLIRGLDEVG